MEVEEEEEHNDDGSSDDKVQKRWGPDKGKGGRIIGPDGKYVSYNSRRRDNKTKQSNTDGTHIGDGNKDEGAVSTPQGGSSGATMSKMQKRRKNDNKSKMANHHRKERALKKTGGGI